MLRAVPLRPDDRWVVEDDLLEIGEIEQIIREQLARLPPHERDAIEARTRMVDRSCRSVAERYGVSPQTVSNWADAAARKLRPELEAFR
jgi:DNA-directed RNA polymerase specialized sigma24 family protein